jgi:hypothetical protein
VAANFPASADDGATVGDASHPTADEPLTNVPTHSTLHQNIGLAIVAIENKLGIGSTTSTPSGNTVLTGTSATDSQWQQVQTAMIAHDSIDSEHYAAGSIDTEHIADDQVTQAKIAAGAVDTTELAADAVDGTKIADDAIAAEHLATNAVTTDAILAGNVTAAKLAEAYYTEAESDARFLGITAKAADSDKLDNLDSTQFLRSDADDTMVGRLSIDNDASVVNSWSLYLSGDHGTASATVGFGSATLVVSDEGNYPSVAWRSANLNYAAVMRLSTAAANKLVLRNAADSGFGDLEVGTLTQSSDLTLKTKTGEAPGLDLVNRLDPFAGHWNDQPGEVNFWLGAQEVAEALTGAGFDPAECGVVQDVEDTMGLQYTQLVPVLVKAVQELTARLEAVEG